MIESILRIHSSRTMTRQPGSAALIEWRRREDSFHLEAGRLVHDRLVDGVPDWAGVGLAPKSLDDFGRRGTAMALRLVRSVAGSPCDDELVESYR